jgi:hypothetical protein
VRPRTIETEQIEALDAAIEQYRRDVTAAELAVARAEQAMLDALVAARSEGTYPIPWRTIGQRFGVSHQAVLAKWRTVIETAIASKSPSQRQSDPLQSTRPNRTMNGESE